MLLINQIVNNWQDVLQLQKMSTYLKSRAGHIAF